MDDLRFGLQVTVLGMGIVFGLLTALWLLLTLALRFESRHTAIGTAPSAGAPGAPAEAGPVTVRPLDGDHEVEPALVAAIAVAVARHADQRRRQAAPAMRSYWPGSLLFASRWVGAGRMRQSQGWRGRPR